jgi:endonuclease/exonuclease/phosphatase family metal-dependent hydrolase
MLLPGVSGAAQAAVATSAPAGNAVRVATYNVMKVKGGKGAFEWVNRRGALVNTVASTMPDVLAVQEVNTQLWQGVRHVDDVVGLLAPLGYQIASADYEGCTIGCTRGAHVFFTPQSMHLTPPTNSSVPAAGMTGLSVIAGVPFGLIQDRNASWAFLTPNGSSRTTLYVSVHLPTQKTPQAEALRVAVATRLRPWANELIAQSGLAAVEVVIAGDFNSYQKRQPNGAQQILTNAGMVDGFAAPELVNANYGTVNYTPKTKKFKGFPPAPYFYSRNPTRIDYVFSTVAPLRHEVVLRVTPDGRFDNAYRASDHNMVMVDLPLR